MKALRAFASILFTLTVSPSLSIAAEPTSFPICTYVPLTGDLIEQSAPAVSGGYVVWQDKRSNKYNIYCNNPANPNDVNGIPIDIQSYHQRFPAISGTTVVWQDFRNGSTNPDIYYCSLPSGTSTPLNFDGQQQNPAISGNIIVWQDLRKGYWDIYRNDGSENAICSAAATRDSPAIDGNIVVWRDITNGGEEADIYGKNLATGADLTIVTAAGPQQQPAISGTMVVWQDNRNGTPNGDPNNDIYGKDIYSNEFIICNAPGEQISPAISGDIVVWEDRRTGSGNIYGYRISSRTIFPICTNNSDQKNPAIDGNFVVWEDYRNGNADIYGARIPRPVAPSKITVSDPNGGEMLMAGSQYTITWQSGGTPITRVKIEYSKDGGNTFLPTDATDIANTGSHSWQIPQDANSTHCLVKISDTTIPPAANDMSDNVFTIFKCNAALTADLSGDCKVDFEDFAIFSSQWLSCGNPYDENCL